MSKRHKMGGKHSRKMFTRTAKGAHPKNSLHSVPMRGGIRL